MNDTALLKEYHAYALEVTCALTEIVGGGSELFSGRIGRDTEFELHKADVPFCKKRIRERNERAWERAGELCDEIAKLRASLKAAAP